MKYKIIQREQEWKNGTIKGFSGMDFLNLSNGSVKLVKIEPMSVYPDHVHPDKTEYAYIIEGNPEFSLDNQSFTSRAGDFFIFPCNIKHAIKNNTVFECMILVGSIKN